jgi:ribonuclease P protein component
MLTAGPSWLDRRGDKMSIRTLRNPSQFKTVYREGKRIATPSAVVIYREAGEPTAAGPYFGFVASKRVGGAVQRNRAKRLLREAVRQRLDEFQRKNVWIVLIARSAMLENNYEDILRDLERAWIDEGLISDTLS